MTKLEISLFHRLSVCNGSTRVSVSARKAQELLCYLILFRDRAHTREMLADTLWADSRPKQSRSNLRKALWALKSTMQLDAADESEPLLQVDSEWIRIRADADLFVDIAEFEMAYDVVEGMPGDALTCEQVRMVRSAVELYTGDLLEGWYYDWCLNERQRLQFMYLAMLDKLIGYSEAHGEYDVGIGYCSRVLRHDRSRERTHRQLMRLFYLAGDRNAALEQYEQCVRALREELDVEPDTRTTELYRQIRGHSLPTPGTSPEVTAGTQVAELSELLQRLEGHRSALAAIHHQIDMEITRINDLVHENSRQDPGETVAPRLEPTQPVIDLSRIAGRLLPAA